MFIKLMPAIKLFELPPNKTILESDNFEPENGGQLIYAHPKVQDLAIKLTPSLNRKSLYIQPSKINIAPNAGKDTDTDIVAGRLSSTATVHIMIPEVEKSILQDIDQQALPPVALLSVDLVDLNSPNPLNIMSSPDTSLVPSVLQTQFMDKVDPVKSNNEKLKHATKKADGDSLMDSPIPLNLSSKNRSSNNVKNDRNPSKVTDDIAASQVTQQWYRHRRLSVLFKLLTCTGATTYLLHGRRCMVIMDTNYVPDRTYHPFDK
uniref:Uncharacterized protein n=1 Tax=Glossina brevipalpis TaxID=37001 RepID=A0A1A9X2N8_9MUSC